jgi:Integrase core domain
MNAGDQACPETTPCPHPSSGGKKPTRTLAGKVDGTDVLRGNVESQPRHAAQLNTHANATCESFLKTLKREEIHATTYRDFEDLQKRLEEFIERYYNQCRLHSALRYRSPAAFEEEVHSEQGSAYAAAAMTFTDG